VCGKVLTKCCVDKWGEVLRGRKVGCYGLKFMTLGSMQLSPAWGVIAVILEFDI